MIQDVIGESNGRFTMEPFPCPSCAQTLVIDALHTETEPGTGKKKYVIRDLLMAGHDELEKPEFRLTSRRDLIRLIYELRAELKAPKGRRQRGGRL